MDLKSLALLLLVTFLSIIPAGLIAARLNHVSLKHVAVEAETETHPDAPATNPTAP